MNIIDIFAHMSDLGDSTFIQLFNSGDPHAFKMVFERYYKVLCSYVYNFIKDSSETDDLVQDLFVVLWSKRTDFDCQEKIASFLFISARNACVNLTKHEKMKQGKLQEYATEKLDTLSEQELLAIEFDKKLEQWLLSLPRECRKVIELSIDGKNNQEIAQILNISVFTVKNQKVKGFKILRNLYREEYFLLLVYLSDIYTTV